MSLARRLNELWYADPPARRLHVLKPLACLNRRLIDARRRAFRSGSRETVRLPVPVVVVGNITLGGTGKTPLVIALVAALLHAGFRPGVVSRGYGGSDAGPSLLPQTPEPARYGDEPSLIAMRTGVPVAIGHKRPEAARLLLDRGVDVIVADDGLQHYRLERDVEICVIDGVRRFGNGKLFPEGPLREPLERLDAVDYRVVNGGIAGDGEIPMTLCGSLACPLIDGVGLRDLTTFRGSRIHAVAGIGNPQRFFDNLRDRGMDVMAHPFDDHHRYTLGDLDFGDDLPVLMTEKDAVKYRSLAASHHWYVPVEADVPGSFLDELVRRLRDIQCMLTE